MAGFLCGLLRRIPDKVQSEKKMHGSNQESFVVMLECAYQKRPYGNLFAEAYQIIEVTLRFPFP
jgi:hypothetical protein